MERFFLFEKYCFPSIINQSNKDFEWLCLFDVNTSSIWKQRINEYISIFPNFKAHYLNIDQTINLTDYLSNFILEDISNTNIDHIVTLRFDNDDSLNIDMINELKNKISNQNEVGFYSFNYGLQYFTKYNSIKGYYFPNNHFLARLEKVNNELETVMACNHTKVMTEYTQFNYKNDVPMWIEIIHEKNIVNEVMFSKKLNIKSILKDMSYTLKYKNLNSFGLDIHLSSSSFFLFFKLFAKFIQKGIYRKLHVKKA